MKKGRGNRNGKRERKRYEQKGKGVMKKVEGTRKEKGK